MDIGTIDFGNILTILIFAVTGLVAYFVKFSAFEKSVGERFVSMEKSFDGKFSSLAIQINTILMRDVESFRARAEALELDNRDLHKRYHGLAEDLNLIVLKITNDMNGIGLKVDRLEKPRA